MGKRYAIQQNLFSIQSLYIADTQADLARLTASTVSTINGSVQSVNVVEGESAGSSRAVVVLTNRDQAVVRFEASEFDAPLIALGQEVRVTAGGIEDAVYTGTVTKIYEDAVEKENSDDNEIVVPVEITLENLDDSLKIGYTVNVELFVQHKRGVLQVPLGSLFLDGEQPCVYIIEDGQVVRRQICTGLYGDRSVEVLEGLQENDLLIINPADVAL